jgi:Zn-dependent M28 family amino/carboxypeptidase
VGAHYDHLGWGGEGSLAPDTRAIHNGADDNASGTAALIETARRMVEGPAPERSVLFIAFSGEEKGLLGSGYFVEEPTVPLGAAQAMINMDMVGRLRDNTLTVYGLGTAEEWDGLIDQANVAAARGTGSEPMVLSKLPDGFGPSDHSSFYGHGIPVLHLFTNTHSQYHRPEDDWETVNGPGIDRVAAFATEIVRTLAGSPEAEAVALTPLEGAGNPHGAMVADSEGDPDAAPSRGYGPYLGTIPDMAPVDFGVRLTGVREDSPAEEAGLRGGDVIVEFGGREVGDLYAYTYALRDHAPGDEVEIVVLRDGERVTLTAVLGQRR